MKPSTVLLISFFGACCLVAGGELEGGLIKEQFLTACTEGNSDEPGLPLETCQKFWDHVRAK